METAEQKGTIGAVDAMAAIEAHTKRIRGAGTNPTAIPVPEWGLTLYAYPATIAEEDEIKNARTVYEYEGRLETGALVDGDYQEILATLIVRAKNKDGSRIFAFAQIKEIKVWAMGVVLRRVVQEINATDLLPKQIEKNS